MLPLLISDLLWSEKSFIFLFVARSVLLIFDYDMQRVKMRCRLSWLTNSALVYKPKCGGGGGGSCGVSAIEYSCTQEPK